MNVVNVVPMRSPKPPPVQLSERHLPVLAKEVVTALTPKPSGVYIDVTVGAGGHTEALLEAGAAQVIAVDRDRSALELAQARLARFGGRVNYQHGAFSDLASVVERTGVGQVDGIVADLGLSSMQLDEAGRGMSFRFPGPLDMRMDRDDGETARELIERLDDDDLTELIQRFGEERRARRVARCIKQASLAGAMQTTLDLRRAVIKAVGPARVGGVDPATRTFQALRIAVNRELEQLVQLLDAAPDALALGAKIAIISFHSLEDRIVKRAFKRRPVWQALRKKPIVATDEELDQNPRARSAKLRVAGRVDVPGGQG